MNDLFPVWNQVEGLLAQGFSVIPVRDKDEPTRPRKTPYSGWKRYQSERITKEDLWEQMERYNTSAIAIICGQVSGYLEVIDLDIKWLPGVDALLFADISKLYPDLWRRLRIHRSPSGGYHILYRVADTTTIPGNQKLSSRPPTAEELALDPKAKPKCFFETRGEGGYVLGPPSMGYSVHKDSPVPLISWAERETLISLCRTYDRMPVMVKTPKPTNYDNSYYDQNPFEHFNNSPAAETVLTDHGWQFISETNSFILFNRPGSSSRSAVHASFVRDKRFYYIFTTNTELESDKGYSPCAALCTLRFNGDYKLLYRWLVDNGYGVINKNREADIIKKRAIDGKPLPSNASQEATQVWQQERTQVLEKYPYGIYWMEDEENGTYKISRELFYQVATGIGYRWHKSGVCHIQNGFIHQVDERSFFDGVKAYITEEDADEYVKIADALEGFFQRAGSFSATRLPLLNDADILRDTREICYKFYQDTAVMITKDGAKPIPYNMLTKLVWSSKVQLRPYAPKQSGRYIEFLNLAIGISDHLLATIGYLAHEYKDENTGYIVVLTEQCPDPKDGGGSGKNLFGNLLKYTTSYLSKAGSQTKFDEKFFQVWNGQRIFAISDVPKNFDFVFLKELSTGNGIHKKLYKNEESVSVEDMPKLMVQTNFSYEVSDGGLKRRIIPLEFTDFFTRCGGVSAHFDNCYFPSGWDADDWGGYDHVITTGISRWLRDGKLSPAPLTSGGWKKQMAMTYGPTIMGFIEEHIFEWIRIGRLYNDDFKTQLKAYCIENNISDKYSPGIQKINKAIEEFCAHEKVEYKSNLMIWDGLAQRKGRTFVGVPF